MEDGVVLRNVKPADIQSLERVIFVYSNKDDLEGRLRMLVSGLHDDTAHHPKHFYTDIIERIFAEAGYAKPVPTVGAGALPTPPNIEREELRERIAHIRGECIHVNDDEEDCIFFKLTQRALDMAKFDGVDYLSDLQNDAIMVAIDRYVEQAVKEAERRGTEKAVIKIMAAKTEGLFDNGELFIKRAPIEQAVVDLLGFERFKAIQDSLPVATPHQKEEGGE